MLAGLKKIFVTGVMITLGVYLWQNAFRPDTFETEAERALAAAKAQAELRQAEAKVRAENAAKLAAKVEEDRAIQQRAWDNAFKEDYQAERDARWREQTSPH